MSNKITINRIKQKIEDKIKSTKKEYKKQLSLYNLDNRYGEPDYTWYQTRLSTLYEVKELINML